MAAKSGTYVEMADVSTSPLLKLPIEILHEILQRLRLSDLKNTRCLNKFISFPTFEYMVTELYIAPRTVVLERLHGITSCKGSLRGIKKLTIAYCDLPEILPTFQQYSENLRLQQELPESEWNLRTEEHAQLYEEYVHLWNDEMTLLKSGEYLEKVKAALLCLPQLDEISFCLEERFDSLGNSFDCWLGYDPQIYHQNDSKVASHVAEVMMTACSAAQLRPKRFSIADNQQELWKLLANESLEHSLNNIHPAPKILSRVDTIDFSATPETIEDILQASSLLELRNLTITCESTIGLGAVFGNIKSSTIRYLKLGMNIDFEEFRTFIISQSQLQHLWIFGSELTGGHWSELLLEVQRTLSLSSLRLEYLLEGDCQVQECPGKPRLPRAEEYFCQTAAKCKEYGLVNPFTSGVIKVERRTRR